MGGFAAIILPSLKPAFKHAYKEAVADGKIRRTSREIAKKNLEKLVSTHLRPSLCWKGSLADAMLAMKYQQLLIDEFKALDDAANPRGEVTPDVR